MGNTKRRGNDGEAVVIELDSRRRASLAQFGRLDHTRYLASDLPDGTIVLKPVAVVPRDIPVGMTFERGTGAGVERRHVVALTSEIPGVLEREQQDGWSIVLSGLDARP